MTWEVDCARKGARLFGLP